MPRGRGSPGHPLERGVEVPREVPARGLPRTGRGPDHEQGARGERRHPVAEQVAQSPGDAVPHDAASHSLADDEAGARWCGLGRDEKVHAQQGTAGAAPSADRLGELRRRAQPVDRSEHRAGRGVRPRARSGPCGAEQPGSRGPHGSTCAAGSRASSRDGGCSAGRCACSRLNAPEPVGGPRGSLRRPRLWTCPRYGRSPPGSNEPPLDPPFGPCQASRPRHAACGGRRRRRTCGQALRPAFAGC